MSSNPAQARHDAAALPRIRDLEQQGLSLRDIAIQLDLDGLPSPRRGKQWNATAVKRILDRSEDIPAPALRAPATGRPDESVHIGGAVNMTGPLTIFSTDPVNITGPVNINPAAPAETIHPPHPAPPIILATPAHLAGLTALSHVPLTYTSPVSFLDTLPLTPSEAELLANPHFLKGRRR